jgi:hypothetical protein
MERAALVELSREQLIDLVLGLAARVAELEAQQKPPPTCAECCDTRSSRRRRSE